MASAPITYAKLDEVKRLQLQVEQMKERLDFISPLLSSVNFVQDWTQRVECEAAVQMMRLKNAQILRNVGSNSDDEPSNAQLETVKWLHFMTDAIMSNVGGTARSDTPPEPQVGRTPLRADPLPMPGRDLGGSTPTADLQRRFGLSGTGPGATSDVSSAPRDDFSVPRRSTMPAGTAEASVENFREAEATRLRAEVERLRAQAEAEAQRSERAAYLAMPPSNLRERDNSGEQSNTNRDFSSRLNSYDKMPPAAMGQGPLGILGGAVGMLGAGLLPANTSRGAGTMPGGGDDSLADSLASLGAGGAAGLNEMTGSGGLVMGKGSWATAYRQAQGARREALRLLCMTDIVTARELSDDLTVISEEHIEECVSIASEMLQTRTLEMWARTPQEAKKFFEARLTALYARKFGEQSRNA